MHLNFSDRKFLLAPSTCEDACNVTRKLTKSHFFSHASLHAQPRNVTTEEIHFDNSLPSTPQ